MKNSCKSEFEGKKLHKISKLLTGNMVRYALCMVMLFICGITTCRVQAKTNDFSVNDGVLIGYLGNDKDVKIPDTVTTIGTGAFIGCDSMVSVTIPETVTNIEEMAFYDCSKLTNIIFPKSVTSIGSYAFEGTPWLTAKQNENPFVIVNSILIDGSTCIGNITIPDTVKYIGDNAFYKCNNITGVNLPDSVLEIGVNAFFWCYSMETINIPDSVTSIMPCAFYGCRRLSNIEIPETVTTLSRNSFEKTLWWDEKQKEGSLIIINSILIDGTTCQGDITIPDTVTSIGRGAFSSSSLKSITIPDSVTYIDASAFSSCKSLKSITIPNSVTYIGAGAFSSCKSLKNITIPNSVTYIGACAFISCSNLKSIKILNDDIYFDENKGTNSLFQGANVFEGCNKLIISAEKGSTAQAYAKKWDIKFKAMGAD